MRYSMPLLLLTVMAAAVMALLAGISYFGEESPADSGVPEVSYGWTVTSYACLDENLYDGGKVEAFDYHGNTLGFYKADFLEQMTIDGSGKGDGIRNPGGILHYNYGVDDGKTYYLTDISLGSYDNELMPWTSDRPSVAVNPPLPYGTMIRLMDLGPDAKNNPEWVNGLLTAKTFHADDTFFLKGSDRNEKKIDIYVGIQASRDPGAAESLLMRNVTVEIIFP